MDSPSQRQPPIAYADPSTRDTQAFRQLQITALQITVVHVSSHVSLLIIANGRQIIGEGASFDRLPLPPILHTAFCAQHFSIES